jgi:hypothetical protein
MPVRRLAHGWQAHGSTLAQPYFVIPAKAGIQSQRRQKDNYLDLIQIFSQNRHWITFGEPCFPHSRE